MTLTWNPRDLEGSTFSTLDCVRIGSHVAASLSQLHSLAPSGGTDTFSYVMPASTDGQAVCDRAVLLRAGGESDGGQGDGGDDENGRGDGGGVSESEQGSANDQGGQGGPRQQQHDGGGTGWRQDDGSHGGDNGFAEKSAVICYSVNPAVTPEAPLVVLFPVAGVTVAGGALLVRRRRSRPRPAA